MTTWAALGAAFLGLALAVLKAWLSNQAQERSKANDLAKVEAEETDAAMARVDTEYDGMQSPRK